MDFALKKKSLNWILLNRYVKSQAIHLFYKYLQQSEISNNDNNK